MRTRQRMPHHLTRYKRQYVVEAQTKTALQAAVNVARRTLLRATTIRSAATSPTTRHSAVCACRPFVTSITKIIMSMIWMPPAGAVRSRFS